MTPKELADKTADTIQQLLDDFDSNEEPEDSVARAEAIEVLANVYIRLLRVSRGNLDDK